MTLEQLIKAKLEEIIDDKWMADECRFSLKIDYRFVRNGEPLLDAIARNITEAIRQDGRLVEVIKI